MNYYNEIDPYAAEWLRNLIADGHISAGEVDERDIRDVRPSDLDGFKQCHFFAGIGVWSYALRLAGVPDDAEVWTGSCPCQPFSAAGQGDGFDDERHLWPAWFHLLGERKPRVVFGEQVASALGRTWLDLVQADLEGVGFAVGAKDICSAGFGAPHRRQRFYFVADTVRSGWPERRTEPRRGQAAGRGSLGKLEHSNLPCEHERASGRQQSVRHVGDECVVAVEHAEGQQEGVPRLARERRATGGFWRDAHWIPGRGGKWRAIEPGTFPLATIAPARMGRLRAYGNAITAEVACEFIEAYIEARSVELY